MNDRVLVVGESLIDIVKSAKGSVDEYPGGSPMNVAIGLGRLGLEVDLHTGIGADERGNRIASHLRESNVRLTSASVDRDATSTSTATIGSTGAATYTFELSSELAPLEVDPEIDLVHAGSIGAVLEPGASVVRDIIAAAKKLASISFDPNIRPALMGSADEVRPIVEAMVRLSDIVKASDEDLRWLYPSAEPEATAARWALCGPAIVVITYGADGARGFAGLVSVVVPGPALRVWDTIGAGDSFMAGLIVAVSDRGLLGAANRPRLAALSADELETIITFASSCAAITVTRPGADPPTRRELARLAPLEAL